jgi:hypothetical protein
MINQLLNALDERTIARELGSAHDEARMSFPLSANTVGDFRQFERIIGEYYNHHFSRSVSRGGALSTSEAQARAKQVLDQAYRRQGGDAVMAFNDARDGTNGGMRVVLDQIADALKEESVEHYVRSAFDRYVAPNAWNEQVAIIRDFINRYGHALGNSIDARTPERYARDFKTLIGRTSTDCVKHLGSFGGCNDASRIASPLGANRRSASTVRAPGR